MKISIVTDEISADPETAVELGREWGVRYFELRGFGTDRVPLFSPFQKARLSELKDEYGVQFTAISPGLFKIPYPLGPRPRFPLRTFDQALYAGWHRPRDLVRFHLEELLPLSIEYAQEIGAATIIAFGFERQSDLGDTVPDEILAALGQAAESAGQAGLELVIEVEAGFWLDTGANAAAAVQAVDHPALGINWDPGNAIVAGDRPYPDGYRAVRDHVRNVHFKDVIFTPEGQACYVLEGEIDWAGQLQALATDGYQGCIAVETHMAPKVHSARAMTVRLQGLLASLHPSELREAA